MISVIICTRDRASTLARCLEHVPQLDDETELIIVDNHSVDDTARVVEEFARSRGSRVRHVFAPRPGLAHARNAGIRAARHPILAFTDDDCLVGEDWVAAIRREFTQDPSLAVLGGRVELADPGDFPMSIRPFGERTEIAAVEQLRRLMIGCNMAFSRRVFDSVGMFDPGLGKGTRIGSGEDTDLLYRAFRHGWKVTYSPAVVVRHAHGRATAAAARAVQAEYARGRGAFYCKYILRGDARVMRLAVREVRRRDGRRLRDVALGALYRMLLG